MFFSWCFLLLVASTGFWETQSVLAEGRSGEFRSAPAEIDSRIFAERGSGPSNENDNHINEIWNLYENNKGKGYPNFAMNGKTVDRDKKQSFCRNREADWKFGKCVSNSMSWESFVSAIIRYMGILLNFGGEDQLQRKRAEGSKDDLYLKIKQAEAEIGKLEASLKGSARRRSLSPNL